VVRFPPPSTKEPPTPSPVAEPPLLIEGTVQATSRVPKPYSTPYKDCLTYSKLHVDRIIEGSYPDKQMIVAMWGMKDNVLLPAAHYTTGQRVRFRVLPLRQAALDLRTVRCADDLDDYEHRPYLVQEE